MSAVDVMGRLKRANFGDWVDLERTHEAVAELMRAVAADGSALRELVDRVAEDPGLWEKSESLTFDDKLVLYDGLEDQGFRLRLHISTSQVREVPHDHRFPLTTLILSGGYLQRIYTNIDGRPVATILRLEEPGACYTLHEDTIHSNIAKPRTALFIVRGPTKKTRATGTDLSSGEHYEKFGAADEPAAVANAHRMTFTRFDQLRVHLQDLSIL